MGTIDGEMEAFYAVLSANFLAGRIDARMHPTGHGSGEIGALDMGKPRESEKDKKRYVDKETERERQIDRYRKCAKVGTPVLAFFYSVFLHNQEGSSTN